jgi:hypothetical protein
MNTKRLLYYINLICDKIDLSSDAFIKRIDALKRGDMEHVEFIEKMMLEPLDEQIRFLAAKATGIVEEEKHGK